MLSINLCCSALALFAPNPISCIKASVQIFTYDAESAELLNNHDQELTLNHLKFGSKVPFKMRNLSLRRGPWQFRT
jgi:hypothetical protein